jgi:cell division septation protein DedD
MDIKFNKDSGGSPQAAYDNKAKQNVILVVIMVLVGVVAYIYFFTGLIKPMQEQKVAEAPVSSQTAKKPLPSPDGAPPKVDTGEVKKDASAPAKPEPASAAPVATVATVATAPASVAPAKPVVKETAKPKEGLKVAEESQQGVKKPSPAVGKAGAEKMALVEKKQTVVAENKPLTAKGVEKKPADMKKPADTKKPAEKQSAAVAVVAKVKKIQQKPAKKVAVSDNVAGSGPWTVLIGNYVLEEAMATDLARVRKAGLEVFVVPGPKKKTHMNRLLLAEFTDRESAQAELTKLKRVTSDAFMIDNAGMHVVYAGSYLHDTWAVAEKERLSTVGFKLTVKRVDVSIPSKNLTAGSFAEKSSAEDVIKKLRAADVKATLSRQ